MRVSSESEELTVAETPKGVPEALGEWLNERELVADAMNVKLADRVGETGGTGVSVSESVLVIEAGLVTDTVKEGRSSLTDRVSSSVTVSVQVVEREGLEKVIVGVAVAVAVAVLPSRE